MSRYANDDDLTGIVAGASDMTEAQRTYALDAAATMIDVRSYKAKTMQAHIALAAHYLSLMPSSTVGKEAGPIAGRSGGGLSVSYATGAKTIEGPHASTAWGRLFDSITAHVPHSPEAV